jgi:hypothetical protein
MNTLKAFVIFISLCLAAAQAIANTAIDCPEKNSANYAVSYQTSWKDGIDQHIERQASRMDAIAVVDLPDFRGPALRTSMTIDDDFTNVANGVPRVELAFVHLTRFAVGGDYLISWSTEIPQDYVFDHQQSEIITQIHQSAGLGSPPFSLMVAGDHYQMDVRGRPAVKNIVFGDTRADRGQVVCWVLHYKPDDIGTFAVTDLYKNGALVAHGGASPNAYPNDKSAYLKIGIYKWDWTVRPSDVSVRTMYYGNLKIQSRVHTSMRSDD